MQKTRKQQQMHPQDRRNLIIFAAAFAIIYLLFDMYLLRPHMEKMEAYHQAVKAEKEKNTDESGNIRSPFMPRTEAVKADPRVTFDHESMYGSINLRGAVIDDVQLHNYYTTLDKEETIAIMSPEGTHFPRYAEVGWINENGERDNLPTPNTIWNVKQKTETGVILEWTNRQGIRFEQEINAIDKFLINTTMRVYNNTSNELTLYPFALITEHGLPEKLTNKWVIHEGPIGYINAKLEERTYKDMPGTPDSSLSARSGWIGFT